MPNDYENPKYTNKNEYHAGDGPFQFPWWAIVIAFVVWWPLGLVFIGLNAAMKNGRLGGFEQKAREATRDRTASGAKLVYNAELLYDTFVVTVYQSVSENGANDNIYNLYVHRCPVKKR